MFRDYQPKVFPTTGLSNIFNFAQIAQGKNAYFRHIRSSIDKSKSSEQSEKKGVDMGFFIATVTKLHIFTVAIKAVGRVIKMVGHSNFGLIGLDRLMSWFGIG